MSSSSDGFDQLNERTRAMEKQLTEQSRELRQLREMLSQALATSSPGAGVGDAMGTDLAARHSSSGTTSIIKDSHGPRNRKAVSVANPSMTEEHYNSKTYGQAYHLAPDRVVELGRLFDEFDSDGNGLIDADELRELVEVVSGKPCAAAFVKALLDDADLTFSGDVSFEEFIVLIGAAMESSQLVQDDAHKAQISALATKAGIAVADYVRFKDTVVAGVVDRTTDHGVAAMEGRGEVHRALVRAASTTSFLSLRHLRKEQQFLGDDAEPGESFAAHREDDEDHDSGWWDWGDQQGGRRHRRQLGARRVACLVCCDIIHPHWVFHGSWDLSVSLVLLITLVTLPMTVAFEEIADRLFYFNLALDGIFFLDFVKNFRTGYIDRNEVVVMDRHKVAKHYILTWCLVDFVTCVPIDAILLWTGTVGPGVGSGSSGGGDIVRSTKLLKLLRLLRFAKLLRLLRVSRAFRYVRFFRSELEDRLKIRIPFALVKVLRLAMLILLLSHLMACGNFLAVRLNNFPAESWVVVHGLEHADGVTQYGWSLFKALYTVINGEEMITSGVDIACASLQTAWCATESRLSLLFLYMGSFLYAIIIAELASIVATLDQAHHLYQQKYTMVNEYMRAKKLPPDLRDQIRDFYVLRFKDQQIFDEEDIMKELSPNLREKILKWNDRDIYGKVPIFKHAPEGSTLDIHVQPMMLFPGEVIFEINRSADAMFFVYSGRVEIFLPESSIQPSKKVSSGAEVVATLGAGCYFGDVSILLEHSPKRSASARVSRDGVCTVYMSRRDELQTFFQDYPLLRAHMASVAARRLARVQHRRGLLDHLPPGFKADAEDEKAGEDFEETAATTKAARRLWLDVHKAAGDVKHARDARRAAARAAAAAGQEGESDRVDSAGGPAGAGARGKKKRNSKLFDWILGSSATSPGEGDGRRRSLPRGLNATTTKLAPRPGITAVAMADVGRRRHSATGATKVGSGGAATVAVASLLGGAGGSTPRPHQAPDKEATTVMTMTTNPLPGERGRGEWKESSSSSACVQRAPGPAVAPAAGKVKPVQQRHPMSAIVPVEQGRAQGHDMEL